MKIAVVGSRDYKDLEQVHLVISILPKDTIIVSGGARGVDTMAKMSANSCDLIYKEFAADWKSFGKKAGFLRNKRIVEFSDRIICFWDGKSKGTKITIDLAKAANKGLEIYYN